MKPYDRMKELVEKLNKYAALYYEQDAPEISDAEYDALYDELRALEESEGYSLKNSPTHRVGGAPQKKFAQSKHLLRLYSLDKCKTREELADWYDRVIKAAGKEPELTAEYKFDGLTLNILYENGALVKAATRGDGTVGEEVTAQVKTISGVPRNISYKGRIEIQGEGIMRLSALEEYNRRSSEPLKNARNGAAGAIRNLDPAVTADRNLSFMAYNIGFSDRHFASQSEMHAFLAEEGFETESDFTVLKGVDEAFAFAEKVDGLRHSLDFLIDGVVFKVNDTALRDEIGYTEKFPKWAIAYKFKADEMTTVLRDVVWQVSRSAKLNPLAVLDPVDIGGVTVKRATLNNYGDILKKKVRIGDRVFIRRSNDVIPEITGVAEEVEGAKEVEKPTVCPACGAPVREEGAFIYCTGEHCAPQIVAALDHFASKDAMDIDGFSEKTAEQFYNELHLTSPVQLMQLKKEDIAGLDRFGDKKAENLVSAIAAAKDTTMDRLLFALGIDGIGKKTAKDLSAKFGTFEALAQADKDALLAVDGIGGILADNILAWFADEGNKKLLSDLYASGVSVREAEKKSGVFDGMRIVLTGSLPTYKRGEATALIENNGGEVASSVSKTVDMVLAGEDAGSKLDKAKKLGIKIIDENEFVAMLNGAAKEN
ncbi:MAG TPA: NAD-dependent DNA ligase LigA [Candidatus Limadaptatus stercorigallinarum]|uniref:DNA ligase n=1 Tax=Candidatus Limadaptatus stercorigallinarum TaxID=2840845 RepID=A0A9D1HTX1_9FIRM|nr:NAD-dependent DNA ligase LigA [Candidatus Limadaptatus stercorigallinarum]